MRSQIIEILCSILYAQLISMNFEKFPFISMHEITNLLKKMEK